MVEHIVIFFILMVAPSVTDDHIENYAIPLGFYDEAEECHATKMWIDEHQGELPRYLFCLPVSVQLQGEQI